MNYWGARMQTNFLNMSGLEFIEISCKNVEEVQKTLVQLGFTQTKKHKTKDIYLFQQENIYILANSETSKHASSFCLAHGNSICSIAFGFIDPLKAYRMAVRNGGIPVDSNEKDHHYPAIYGIGGTLIYFVHEHESSCLWFDFESQDQLRHHKGVGFNKIDHITNNVYQGEIERTSNFYQKIFGFTKIKEFIISGKKTGLRSLALRSPDGSFSLPINEGSGDANNQIDEYLRMHNGPGIQHVAFHTENIFRSCRLVTETAVATLSVPKRYYEFIQNKLPWLDIDVRSAAKYNILIDSEQPGTYLLQAFTRYLFGPIFVEIIQRNNEDGFLNGNFQSLFDSLEDDQFERGVF